MSQAYNYIECAFGGPFNRGTFIKKDELKQWTKRAVIEGEPLYRSMYLYTDDVLKYMEENNKISGYYGSRHIDNILIDIDKKDNSDELTLQKTRDIIGLLMNEYDLSSWNMRAYFSGSGYHIILPNSLFRFDPAETLPHQVKYTMAKVFGDLIDPMVYMRTGLYRVAHTVNNKTNLFKIPITIKDLLSKDYNIIHMMAKEHCLEYPYEELTGDGELESEKVNYIPRIRTNKKVIEPTKIVTCIQALYNRGPQEGNRNLSLIRIASHMRRWGIPSNAAKASLLEWNNKSLNEDLVIDKIEYSYNKGYKFGCNDTILSSVCNPKCIHYRRKDYLVDVMDSGEMQSSLVERLETDFSGRSYNFSKALGMDSYDCTFYPGELITIFGPTGSGKSTLAHNIALGYNHSDNKIDDDNQITVLYLSLELSGWYMHRRTLQIVSDKSKKEVEKDLKGIYIENQEQIEHMVVQTRTPTIQQIQEKISELSPSMVIVDYIDLVETPPHIKGEYEQVKYISHNLSNLAVNMDTIIIQVSQVSREYSRNQVLDLYAGKGSGAIENASRKVIGLNGQANTSKKQVKVFKNTDGELFETELEWYPSFRLRRAE